MRGGGGEGGRLVRGGGDRRNLHLLLHNLFLWGEKRDIISVRILYTNILCRY